MSDVQLKCPSCGAPINFDVPSGKMKCSFCGASFTVEEVNQFNGISQANAELDAAHAQQAGTSGAGGSGAAGGAGAATTPETQISTTPAEGQPGWVEPPPTYLDEATGQKMAQFQCNSCGGEIIGSPDMVSARCPWCNNNFVATGQLTSTRVPDRMIPFAMTKEQALEAFKANMKGLKLIPREFKQVSVDDIQGVYVPYWLYDATVAGEGNFSCENLRTWTDSEYEYTQHQEYQVYRSANVAFLDVPVAGTTKVTDKLTESIEPFDYNKSVAFSPAYLTGFMTNKYDVEAQDANPRALERMKDSTEEVLRNSISGYDTVSTINTSIQPAFGELEYVFLPMWLMNVDFQGKNYNYAMNGQTGKFVGTFPVSERKYWGGLIGIAIPIAIIFGAIFIPFLMPLFFD
ncbi:ATP-binding protein [uncultured Mobiluncus sp.]|uniref:ATP-binding protein n=1 Tax=uncultured Mobiluncus sp. TaxID=293425 RepID=UPI002618D94A|nr:ATP-binding protein [uncultured Mobiluncus sp.]